MDDAVIEVRRSNGAAASGWVLRLGAADIAMDELDDALVVARKLARTTHDTLGLPVAVVVNDGMHSVEVFRIASESPPGVP